MLRDETSGVLLGRGGRVRSPARRRSIPWGCLPGAVVVECDRCRGHSRPGVEVGCLVLGADEVRLSDSSVVQDRPDGPGVIGDVDPVAYVPAVAVEPGAMAVEDGGDLACDELLDMLTWPVVVRATRCGRGHPEGTHPGSHQMVGASLGCRVGR